jgi:hypothetical protein
MSLKVCMLSSTYMRVEKTLARPRPVVTALSLVRYGTKGVYALERVHACREYDRGATPCCHGAVSGAL